MQIGLWASITKSPIAAMAGFLVLTTDGPLDAQVGCMFTEFVSSFDYYTNITFHTYRQVWSGPRLDDESHNEVHCALGTRRRRGKVCRTDPVTVVYDTWAA